MIKNRRAPSLFAGMIATNAGVLLALLLGPNGEHRNLPLAYTGVALAVIGLVMMLRVGIARRRNTLVPPSEAR